MALSEGQEKILNLVAELTDRTVSIFTRDTVVIEKSGLPLDEARTHLTQMEGLGFIAIGIKVSGADYRMVNMTKEGLQASSANQVLR